MMEWCSNRSKIAVVNIGSPITSPHSPKLLLEARMTGACSGIQFFQIVIILEAKFTCIILRALRKDLILFSKLHTAYSVILYVKKPGGTDVVKCRLASFKNFFQS